MFLNLDPSPDPPETLNEITSNTSRNYSKLGHFFSNILGHFSPSFSLINPVQLDHLLQLLPTATTAAITAATTTLLPRYNVNADEEELDAGEGQGQG